MDYVTSYIGNQTKEHKETDHRHSPRNYMKGTNKG